MAACSRRKRDRRTDRREYQQSDSKSDELFRVDIGLIDSPCKGRIKCEHEVVSDLSPAPIATVQQRIPCMKYGYARVSTDGQSLDAQVKQLRAEGCAKVYREKA